jgi:hypothetical protein
MKAFYAEQAAYPHFQLFDKNGLNKLDVRGTFEYSATFGQAIAKVLTVLKRMRI